MTPEQETDIVFAAIGIAHGIARPLLDQPDPLQLDDVQKLALGVMFLFDRWRELTEAPKQAAERFDRDGIRAHTKVCPLNPVVQELERLRAAVPTEVDKDALRAVRDLAKLAHVNCAGRADAVRGFEISARAIVELNRIIGDEV